MITLDNAQSIGKRENQEDYFASMHIKDGVLCIVADGMGGYEGGEVASTASVKSFIQHFEKNFDHLSVPENLLQSLEIANKSILEFKESDEKLRDMGTTLVCIYITKNNLWWISVGDSLLYRYRDNKLVRINENHSLAGEYQKAVQMGKLSQEEADAKTDKHAVTSALSGYEIPLIDLRQEPFSVKENDIYILASDGIETLEEKQIEILISKEKDSAQLAQRLLQEVKKVNNQYQDNTSVIVVKVDSQKVHIDESSGKNNKKYWLLMSILLILITIISFYLYREYKNEHMLEQKKDENITKVKSVKNIDTNTSSNIVESNKTVSPKVIIQEPVQEVNSSISQNVDSNLTHDESNKTIKRLKDANLSKG